MKSAYFLRDGVQGHTHSGSGTICDHCSQPHAIMIEYKQPDARRQVAVPAMNVEIGNHARQGHLLASRDFLKAAPEFIFETDAGLVPGDNDGAFDDRRLHVMSSGMAIRLKLRLASPPALYDARRVDF